MWGSSSTSFTYPTTTGTDQQDDIVKKYESMIKKMSKSVLKAVKDKDYKGAEECARAILFLEEAIRVRNNPVQWGNNSPIVYYGDHESTGFQLHDNTDEVTTIRWTDSTGETKNYTQEEWLEKFSHREE